MKIKCITLAVTALLVLHPLSAASLDDVYQQMLKAYERLNTWQAAITQTNYFAQSKAKLTSTGNFYYQKGKICIRYKKPNEQYLLIENGLVTVYDKSANVVIKSELGSSVQSLNPVEIIKSYWKNAEKTRLKSPEGSTSIKLKPAAEASLKEISFTVANSTGFVSKLTYIDKQGNSVTVSFTRMRANRPIRASVWKLDIPKSAQIINTIGN